MIRFTECSPPKPVKFLHEGGWKTGVLMDVTHYGCVTRTRAYPGMSIVRLSCTGEVVIVNDSELQPNPCREDERKAEAAVG